MNKFFQSCIILIVFSSVAFAQVTITSEDVKSWSNGSYYRFTANDGGVPAPTFNIEIGVGKVWDLSSFTSAKTEKIYFGPALHIEDSLLGGVTHIWGNSVDLLTRRGAYKNEMYFAEACTLSPATLIIKATYNKDDDGDIYKSTFGFLDFKDTLFKFPLQMGQVWTSRMKYNDSAYFNDIEFVSIKREVNSTGTIKLPGGESLPAIGMRELVRATGGPSCGPDTTYLCSFVWFTKKYGMTARVDIKPVNGVLDTNYFKPEGPKFTGDSKILLTDMVVRVSSTSVGFRSLDKFNTKYPDKIPQESWTLAGRSIPNNSGNVFECRYFRVTRRGYLYLN